ncbi:MAG: Fic family protein [SAR324 cluster bacterium]|nr:Fic family protein [SAR324 cluster bacterium]
MKHKKIQNTVKAEPVGYSELIRRYSLNAVPHWVDSNIIQKGGRKTVLDEWLKATEFYPRGYWPGEGLGDQLTFALKYEGINLEILALLFQKVDEREIEHFIKQTATRIYSRKIWFLYEFLTGRMLNLEPTRTSNYANLLDGKAYYTAKPVPEKRQKINNNLLGNRSFCPVIRRTGRLEAFEFARLDRQSLDLIKDYPEELMQRALTYLYTKETKSSFAIEKATPDQRRSARFVELLKLANERDFFNKASLFELQQAIVDERFANSEYRLDQNYVGQTVSIGNEIIHFVAPKPEDLDDLMEGMFIAHERMTNSGLNPVLIASVIAFGFVFMHPFDDGNGRIHRFLIHNVLARAGYTPEGVIFPISAVMLRKTRDYDRTLELFSKPLMPLVDFKLGDDGQMTVVNETALHYRYVDMTEIAESLFRFIQETLETELVQELEFIRHYDQAKRSLADVVEMPDRLIDLFIRFCLENACKMSKTKRKRFFNKLNDKEITKMEASVQEAFGSST